jgi:hypothetical protein
MAYPPYIREKARDLRRKKKLTSDELAERLAISRTTIYYWVRDIPIPRSGAGWPKTAQQLGTKAMQSNFSRLRDAAYEEGSYEFWEFAEDWCFRDFVVLYMAEGYKRSRHTVSLANSDPEIIKLAWRWIDRFSRNATILRVQHHGDQVPAELTDFWSRELGIAHELIRMHRKKNSGQLRNRVWRCKHGVASVTAHDTLFRAELEAWMDCVRSEWL